MGVGMNMKEMVSGRPTVRCWCQLYDAVSASKLDQHVGLHVSGLSQHSRLNSHLPSWNTRVSRVALTTSLCSSLRPG